MTRRLSELGIEDEGILESHYVRGLLYVNGAIYDDGWDNSLVREGTRQVFSSMDERIVLNSCLLYTSIFRGKDAAYSQKSVGDCERRIIVGNSASSVNTVVPQRSKQLFGCLGTG